MTIAVFTAASARSSCCVCTAADTRVAFVVRRKLSRRGSSCGAKGQGVRDARPEPWGRAQESTPLVRPGFLFAMSAAIARSRFKLLGCGWLGFGRNNDTCMGDEHQRWSETVAVQLCLLYLLGAAALRALRQHLFRRRSAMLPRWPPRHANGCVHVPK